MTSMTTYRSSLLVIALLVGQILDGHTRTCIYDSGHGTYAINIEAADQCPASIEVSDE